MTQFTARVIETIQRIPQGKVMTYGQIADLAGNPRSARQVSRILHSMSQKYHLPWQRVVNSKGCISLKAEGYAEQKRLLIEEGVCFEKNGSIDLFIYLYDPFDLD